MRTYRYVLVTRVEFSPGDECSQLHPVSSESQISLLYSKSHVAVGLCLFNQRIPPTLPFYLSSATGSDTDSLLSLGGKA